MSDSVEKVREQSETFVNRGKDAWNLHYAETETALRQKSDDASQHVTEMQAKTQSVKVRPAYALERHRMIFEKTTPKMQPNPLFVKIHFCL
jgi:hypothetical protein